MAKWPVLGAEISPPMGAWALASSPLGLQRSARRACKGSECDGASRGSKCPGSGESMGKGLPDRAPAVAQAGAKPKPKP